ncbi:SxtJ family membrane protein [Desulfovibrio aminophilus]|nr:SxtJ family membrane protein [Desulfovibrio aminophilus]MCM0755543.1 SxtJ family membrane protein [Desulfovibrio aminophilus]
MSTFFDSFPKKLSKAQAVDTGMALVLVCLLLGLFRERAGWFWAAAGLLVVNMTVPAVFKPAAKIWLGLAHLLGSVMSRVLLGAVFLLVVAPVGLLRRALGKDTLRLREFKKNDASVFLARDKGFEPADLERPY